MPPPFRTTPDSSELALDLAVLLFDRFTGAPELIGNPAVVLAGSPVVPYQKSPESTYLFFALRPGSYTVQVRPADDSPYYLGVDIPVTLPMPNPSWPAFPDVTLADPNLPPGDPAQTPAYRAQRDLAGLRPAPAYPFPAGATLVFGTVTSGGAVLSGARVRNLGGDEDYLTGDDGRFVLALARPAGRTGTITVRASYPIHPDVDLTVEVRRGTTTTIDIDMGP